ncbi:MAG: transcriptional regulator NrdR [Kosmotogaceae bacterium]
MKCPFCSHAVTRVIDTRLTDNDSVVRRRRECERCKGRFTTYERFERRPIFVIKKDGTKQNFDRGKILGGIVKACEKRPVTPEEMEHLTGEIENEIIREGKTEIESHEIGEFVMETLKKKDRVAYVRYASVYKEFRDLDHFMDIIGELKDELKNR